MGEELSDFEKQRLANIAERDQLLKKLTQEAQSSGLNLPPPPRPSTQSKKPTHDKSKKKKPQQQATPKHVEQEPRRTSSRLRGIAAESDVAKRKADDEQHALMQAERAKKVRRSDAFGFSEMVVSGQKTDAGGGGGLVGGDVVTKGVAKPYERTFGEEDIEMTTDKDLRALREEMSGLKLWEPWEPNRTFSLFLFSDGLSANGLQVSS